MKFNIIPKDTFDNLQLDAGVLLKTFSPESATAPTDEAIITATTGGINITCVPTYSDMGEDVDNCPVNTMELKKLESWACGMKFTALDMSAENLRLALGAADVSGDKVTIRRDLKDTDFTDIWWVGDTASGGMVAVCLKNALSDEGLSIQTSKNSKGHLSVSLVGHVSIDAQDEMPMEFYSAAATTSTT